MVCIVKVFLKLGLFNSGLSKIAEWDKPLLTPQYICSSPFWPLQQPAQRCGDYSTLPHFCASDTQMHISPVEDYSEIQVWIQTIAVNILVQTGMQFCLGPAKLDDAPKGWR